MEIDNTDFQTSNQNIRSIVFNESTYDNANGNVINFDVDDKKVCIYSSLMIYGSNTLLTAYQDNETLTLTSIAMNFKANATTSRIIYTAGFYNLSDILIKYSTLASKNYQISNYMRLLNENSVTTNSATNTGSRTGEIALKNNNADAITSVANAKLWSKAVDFAHLPDNYGVIYLRYWTPTDATTEDLFEGLDDAILLRIPFVSTNYLSNTPTKHKRITDFDNKIAHTAFVDGIAPSSAITTTGTATTNWSSYSCELKAGYNSCIMPFKKLAYAAPTGITFYKVSSINGNTITYEPITPTNNNAFTDGTDWTPVIIKAETAGVYTFVGRDAITSWTDITYKSKTVGGSNDGLFWVGSFSNDALSGSTYASNNNYVINATGTAFEKVASTASAGYYRAFLSDSRTTKINSQTLNIAVSGDNLNVTVPTRDVTVTAPTNGVIKVNSSSETPTSTVTVAEGSTVTLEMVPSDGYSLSTVSVVDSEEGAVALTGEGNSRTFTMPASNVTVSAMFTAKAAPTVENLAAATPIYNGNAQNLVTTPTVTGGTITYSTEETGTYTDAIPQGTNAGNYTVWYKVAGDATHTDIAATQVASVSIAQKALTITADAKSKELNATDPTLTYTSDGLVGSDAITGALAREEGEAVGTYNITQGTLTAGANYDISFTGAKLTITGEITADDEAKDSDNNVQETYTVSGSGAEVKTVTATAGATTIELPASVSGTNVTALAADAFSGVADKTQIQSIDLSATQVTNVTVNRESGVFAGFPAETMIYLPAGTGNAAATGQKNVVIGGICADFEMTDTKSYSFAKDFTATTTTLTRDFTDGQACTICLPYSVSTGNFPTNGKFYQFNGVDGTTVKMQQINSDLVANTPYLFMPGTGTTDNITQTGTISVSMSADPATATQNDFKFVGVYADKNFTDAEIQKGIYGYLAEDYGTNDAGEFIKATSGAFIKGMRGYLEYCGTGDGGGMTDQQTNASRGSDLENPLSGVLTVVLYNSDGSTTSLGQIRLVESNDTEAVYNLNGQRVTMNYKGIVIKNGKKIVNK